MNTSLLFPLVFCARIHYRLFFRVLWGLFFNERPYSIIIVHFLIKIFFKLLFFNFSFFLFLLIFFVLFDSLSTDFFIWISVRVFLDELILFFADVVEIAKGFIIWELVHVIYQLWISQTTVNIKFKKTFSNRVIIFKLSFFKTIMFCFTVLIWSTVQSLYLLLYLSWKGCPQSRLRWLIHKKTDQLSFLW